MPNWCEGTLKVRGSFKNLKNFVMNGLKAVNIIGAVVSAKVEMDETYLKMYDFEGSLYMKNTRRHFCEPDYIEIFVDEPEEITTLLLPMKAAWCIDSDGLLALCKEFHVDMRIEGFERGMEFSQIIEIVDGEILQDDEIKYTDWNWECPCPTLGG